VSADAPAGQAVAHDEMLLTALADTAALSIGPPSVEKAAEIEGVLMRARRAYAEHYAASVNRERIENIARYIRTRDQLDDAWREIQAVESALKAERDGAVSQVASALETLADRSVLIERLPEGTIAVTTDQTAVYGYEHSMMDGAEVAQWAGQTVVADGYAEKYRLGFEDGAVAAIEAVVSECAGDYAASLLDKMASEDSHDLLARLGVLDTPQDAPERQGGEGEGDV